MEIPICLGKLGNIKLITMKTPIDKQRWILAQNEEKLHHTHESDDEAYKKWNDIYSFYFRYLNIDTDLNNKSIIEIGPARIAALLYCNNFSNSYIVEPTTYENSEILYQDKQINFIRETYEDCDSPKVDEIWLFNVLQHIIDPDKFIEKAKKNCNIIKFFEPINTPIEVHHPHSFTENDYKNYFGDSVKLYKGGTEIYHTADCVYGIYKCN
jgi:hypothetical protein